MGWRICHSGGSAAAVCDAGWPRRRRRKRLVFGDDGHLLSEGREAGTDH
jgi:hypothetical protein